MVQSFLASSFWAIRKARRLCRVTHVVYGWAQTETMAFLNVCPIFYLRQHRIIFLISKGVTVQFNHLTGNSSIYLRSTWLRHAQPVPPSRPPLPPFTQTQVHWMALGFPQRVELGVHVRIWDTRKGSNGLGRKNQARGGWMKGRAGQRSRRLGHSLHLPLSQHHLLFGAQATAAGWVWRRAWRNPSIEGLTTPDSAALIKYEILEVRDCTFSSVCLRPALGLANGQVLTVCDLIRTASGIPNHFSPKLIKKLKF